MSRLRFILKGLLPGALLALAFVPATQAFTGDSHYYLRFALSLEACFSWDEAHLIASADWMMDQNRTVVAEKDPFRKHNKIYWHAFGHPEDRFNDLWERVLREKDLQSQLIKLGQFTHFLEDWESHAGYGVRLGHARATIAGKDPDSLGLSRVKNLRMVMQTLDHLFKICAVLGRDVHGHSDPDRMMAESLIAFEKDPIMDDLFTYSNPRWKIGFGKRGKKGKKVLADNEIRIEEFVLRRADVHPERKVPDDFVPGGTGEGIPAPIGIRYDKKGNVTEIYGVEVELEPGYEGDEDEVPEPEEPKQYEGPDEPGDPDIVSNLEVEILGAVLEKKGWRVRIEVDNLGESSSPKGSVEVLVIDALAEQLLGKASESLSKIGGEDERQLEVLVDTGGNQNEKVLITAVLNVDDLSANNNYAHYSPWEDPGPSPEGDSVDADLTPTKQIEILETPKVWWVQDSEGEERLAMVFLVVVPGGDSSHRLGDVHLSFGDGLVELVRTAYGEDLVWSTTEGAVYGMVPAKGFLGADRDEGFCRLVDLPDSKSARYSITLDAEDEDPITETFSLPPDVIASLRESCQ